MKATRTLAGALLALCASAASGCVGEPHWWSVEYRNDSATTYIVTVDGGDSVVPAHSNGVFSDNAMNDEGFEAVLYATDCRRLGSKTLTETANVLVLGSGGSLSTEFDETHSSATRIGMLPGWGCTTGSGWYVVARNDSEQDLLFALGSASRADHTWLLPAHRRASLYGEASIASSAGRQLRITLPTCQALGTFSLLSAGTVILVDSGGKIRLGTRSDYWQPDPTVTDVNEWGLRQASGCEWTGSPGNAGSSVIPIALF